MDNLTKLSDDELIALYREGSSTAFNTLVLRYDAPLHTYIRMSVNDGALADDIFQDTFTIVWQSRKFINLDSSFSAYLYTIMRNRILNMLRDLEYQEQLKDYFVVSSCRCKR